MTNPLSVVILVLVSIHDCVGLAQQSQPPTNGAAHKFEKPTWLPKDKYPEINFFAKLSYARTTADQNTIQVLQPNVMLRDFSRPIEQTSYTTEWRTRNVKVDGKEVEQSYTVAVPYTMTVQETFTSHVAESVEKYDFPIATIRAWELSGKELTQAELVQRLSKPTKVLFERLSGNRLAKHKFEPVDPFFGGVVRLDTIVIFCPQEIPEQSATPGGSK